MHSTSAYIGLARYNDAAAITELAESLPIPVDNMTCSPALLDLRLGKHARTQVLYLGFAITLHGRP